MADLIGDVDPMKVAEGRLLGDPETIHFGLIPRSHRGIVAINELPDLAERIQVAMLNVMEERDIQIRGYVLRLPLDVLVVASANPEDYTNRGRIITPLKDRFGAEIRTHYPTELDDEVAVIRQEAHLVADVPDHLVETLARFTRKLRDSTASTSAPASPPGSRSPAPRPSPRPPSTAPPARARTHAVARVVDLETAVDVLGGKIEFETGEEGREREVLTHLLRTATAETVRTTCAASTSRCSSRPSRRAGWSPPASRSRPATSSPGCRCCPGESELYDEVCDRLEARPTTAARAGAIELALEGLYLARKIGKDSDGGGDGLWLSPTMSRYRRYDGGDPLAPPVDLAEALDAIGEDVMAGYRPSGRCGSSSAAAARPGRASTTWPAGSPSVAASCRAAQPRRHAAGVRELLDRAVLEERKQLARDVDLDDADRALREMQLENLPPNTAAAVSELASYDWQSREAREAYEQIKDLLGRELLDQRFAGMKQALENATDEDRAAVNEMLEDLNDLLEKHRRGEDTQEDFDEFMAKHGDFFPENPQNIDELLDALAQRSAAAQRMLNSMSPEQREQLMQLSAAGVRLAGADGAAGPDGRQPPGAAARRGLGRLRAVRGRGGPRSRRRHRRAPGPRRARRPRRAALPVLRRCPARRRRPRPARPPARRPGGGRRPHPPAARAGAARQRLPQARLRRPVPAEPQGDAPARQGAAARRRRADVGTSGPARAARGRGGRRAVRRDPRVAVRRHRAVGPAAHGAQRRTRPRTRPRARRLSRLDRGRRGAGDRGPHPGRGRAAGRHVVLDGDGRPLGADEAHRARAAHADQAPGSAATPCS